MSLSCSLYSCLLNVQHVEEHAFSTYDKFLTENEDELKTQPAPIVSASTEATDWRERFFLLSCSSGSERKTHVALRTTSCIGFEFLRNIGFGTSAAPWQHSRFLGKGFDKFSSVFSQFSLGCGRESGWPACQPNAGSDVVNKSSPESTCQMLRVLGVAQS